MPAALMLAQSSRTPSSTLAMRRTRSAGARPAAAASCAPRAVARSCRKTGTNGTRRPDGAT
eukprot:15440591-Alexandrium_andersonii.AAC.1